MIAQSAVGYGRAAHLPFTPRDLTPRVTRTILEPVEAPGIPPDRLDPVPGTYPLVTEGGPQERRPFSIEGTVGGSAGDRLPLPASRAWARPGADGPGTRTSMQEYFPQFIGI